MENRFRFMSVDVRFVRQHPLESFVHAQKLKRMVTNMNIRWLFCACPFCPVYLLLLFAIHSLDVRGSFLLNGDVRRYSFYVRSMFEHSFHVLYLYFLCFFYFFFFPGHILFFAFFNEALWRCSPHFNFHRKIYPSFRFFSR